MGVGVRAQAVLQVPSAFISKCTSKGVPHGPASTDPGVGEQLPWELAQTQGRHVKGASLPSYNLGREAEMGVLRAPGRR